MKALLNQNLLRRTGALLLAALLIAGQLGLIPAARAEYAPSPLVFTLAWGDQQVQAAPVAVAGYENSSWLYLPMEAFYADPRLYVSDTFGQYARIGLEFGPDIPAEGLSLNDFQYFDAGDQLGGSALTVICYDAQGLEAARYSLYLSTTAQSPAIPEMPLLQSVDVAVVCLDRDTGAELNAFTENHVPGPFTVTAPALQGYDLDSDAMISGQVDANGANPARVEFWYRKQVQPAEVAVVCLDRDTNQELNAFTENHVPGPFTVTAPALQGYDLDSDAAVNGQVDANGANPARVEFWYRKQVQPAEVTVVCLDRDTNQELNAFTETHTPGPFTINAPALQGYDLDSDAAVNGQVDAGGANPARVEFWYRKQVQPAEVAVVCLDRDTNQELNAFTENHVPGPFTVTAPALQGYDLDSDAMINGQVDANGANPARVEFWYRKQVQPAEVTVVCLDRDTNQELNAFTETHTPGPFTINAPALQGYDLDSDAAVNGQVDANGANPARVEFWYRKQVQPAEVTVVCLDRDTNQELNAFTETHTPGQFTINAPALQGYDLDSDAMINGQVDANGANPARVEFWYRQHVDSVTVTVSCADENGIVFDSYARDCAPGVTTVEAEPREGYDLDNNYPGQVFVNVTAQGADVNEIVFHYVRRVADVTVPVYYRDAQGVDLMDAAQQVCRAGDNDIAAPVLAGYAVDAQVKRVTVTAEGASPAEVVFVYAPLATAEPEPTATPVPVLVETAISVTYVDNLGNLLAQVEAPVTQGENYIKFNPDRVSSAYTLRGEESVRVTVDASGVCSPESVTFLLIAPVDVPVYCLDFDDRPVADAQTVRCVAGVNPIDVNPQNLLPGYILADDGRKYVTVDENGADVQEIVFRFGREETNPDVPTDTPEPSLALVPVYYRTTTGDAPFYVDNTVKCFTGENTVTADASRVPDGYKPEGPTSVTVVVDQNGAANPAQVEFLYNVSDMTRSVMVYYRSENGQDLVAPQSVAVGIGNRTVSADPALIPQGWQVAGESDRSVRLEEDGTLTPDYVVFTLQEIPPTEAPTEPPKPTVAPVEYPVYDMDAYCYPKNDGAALHSFPSDDESNVIGQAKQGDLTHIEGYVVNSLGDTWYIVTANEQTGYMRDSQVHVLSQEDMNALFGTPVPATPSPVPETPIPDGAFIDRWGSLTADSVNFRAEASTQSKSQGKYNRNQKVFIYDSVTMDGEKWYRANIGGKDGYMMARFIDLMSGVDSEAYQASLSTPMPVRTETPSPAPVTPTPTPEPVTAPPTQEPSPTPAPYNGYALTARAVDLRTGVTVSDTTLITLPSGALLYLYGQAYVNGVCWDSAEEMTGHASGFVPDEALRRISAEEAAPYLASLHQTDTPTPPTVKPEPYTGYAVTGGSNVMLRNYADEKAEIAAVLGENEVVWVMSQEYVAGSPYYWEVVQYGKLYGYVRSDQLRMMEPEERAAYEQSLRTPAPEVIEYVVTVPPVSQGSMSSYGYVTTNNVRLRSGATTASTPIRMMSRYAFALVLGSETTDGQLWYHINQAGSEGYVMGDYFKVLSLGELSEFLTSDEYKQSVANTASGGAGGAGAAVSGGITSVEDFNSGVWKNPALTNVTYEPFSNIIATPTPDVEQLATATPTDGPTEAPTQTPTEAPEASGSPAPLTTAGLTAFTTPEPNAKTSGGSGWIWAGLAAAVLAGGGAYGYSLYRANQRRAAQRAAQRRQQQQQARAGGGYARPTQQVPGRAQQSQRPQYQQSAQAAPQQTSVFAPPRPQNTPVQGSAPQQTQTYQPPQSAAASQTPPTAQPAQTPQRHRRSDKHQAQS